MNSAYQVCFLTPRTRPKINAKILRVPGLFLPLPLTNKFKKSKSLTSTCFVTPFRSAVNCKKSSKKPNIYCSFFSARLQATFEISPVGEAHLSDLDKAHSATLNRRQIVSNFELHINIRESNQVYCTGNQAHLPHDYLAVQIDITMLKKCFKRFKFFSTFYDV